MKSGPIILIDDDEDDKAIFEEVLKEIGYPNELIWFERCHDAFDYLKKTTQQPFVIVCDVNLPVQTGIEFKRSIDEDPELRRKSIPFVFYSTSAAQETVTKAYTELTVQGYFQKRNDYNEIRENIRLILEYWKNCRHPNTNPEETK